MNNKTKIFTNIKPLFPQWYFFLIFFPKYESKYYQFTFCYYFSLIIFDFILVLHFGFQVSDEERQEVLPLFSSLFFQFLWPLSQSNNKC